MSVDLRTITQSEGSPPRARALAHSLELPPHPGGAISLRSLLRVGSVPRYRPERWNDDPLDQGYNNCYNYATDVLNWTYAQPGRGGGLAEVSLDCPGETAGAIADGLVSTGAAPSLEGIEFGHVVALVIAPGRDFHWYRRGRDGLWSHKPGGTEATNLDHSGQPIPDPRSADRWIYTEFCGFFAVPRGAISIAGSPPPTGRRAEGPTGATEPAEATTVRMLVFSGRPDPEWQLDADEDAALAARLATVRLGTRLTAAGNPTPGRLGYRGFVINRPGRAAGTRDITIVRAGLVNDVRLTGSEYRPDTGVEDELLDQARRRGFTHLI